MILGTLGLGLGLGLLVVVIFINQKGGGQDKKDSFENKYNPMDHM